VRFSPGREKAGLVFVERVRTQIGRIHAGKCPKVEVNLIKPKDLADKTEHALDSVELAALIRVTIADGTTIGFSAPGKSMEPFIHSGDKIYVSSVIWNKIRLGDVLVFVHPQGGKVLAHRVVQIADRRFLCKGDNISVRSDGWITFPDVLGRVDQVERDGEPIRLGLGLGKRMIALLSRENKLVPSLNRFRRVKASCIKLFSSRRKQSK